MIWSIAQEVHTLDSKVVVRILCSHACISFFVFFVAPKLVAILIVSLRCCVENVAFVASMVNSLGTFSPMIIAKTSTD